MNDSVPQSINQTIEPTNFLQGEVLLPGDKSISHRAALLASMSQGLSTINNFSESEDCLHTLKCLEEIGVKIKRSPKTISIEGLGVHQLKRPIRTLHAGNSGTLMRLMSGMLSGLPFPSRIDGDASLTSRPMDRIIVPLTAMGGQIEAHEHQFPPLIIRGQRLKGIKYELPVASAQVKSCLLLAGLLAKGTTTLIEPIPTRNHTELLLPSFGGKIVKKGNCIKLDGEQSLQGSKLQVPGDISAAAFFIVAASIIPGSKLKLRSVGLNPSRSALLDLLMESGAHIQINRQKVSSGEPIGDISISYSDRLLEQFPRHIGKSQIPLLIDEIPVLAILGTQLKHGLEITEAAELRTKECDRISAIVENLRKLGIDIQEKNDGFRIPPGQTIRGGNVRTRGDHRIAMAFAVAGLISHEAIVLDNSQCCDISFPGFFEELKSIIR